MPPLERKEYLQRLIMGLEQSIENLKYEIPYYREGDIQLVYAKKFLASSQENLAKAQAELQALPPENPSGN